MRVGGRAALQADLAGCGSVVRRIDVSEGEMPRAGRPLEEFVRELERLLIDKPVEIRSPDFVIAKHSSIRPRIGRRHPRNRIVREPRGVSRALSRASRVGAGSSTRLTWSSEHVSRATAASPCPPAPRSSRFLVDSLLLLFSGFLVDSLLLLFSGFLVDSLLLLFSGFLVDSLLLALSGFRGRDFPCADHLS